LENPRGRRKLVYDRLTALQPKISELQDQHAGDPKGLSDALSTLYREYNANPLKACLDPQLIISILYSAALYVPAVSTSHHQALHDRLAHAAVIRTK
jgi:membrane protein insertase Oxa1/YidC/SpoIIIJ